MTSKCLCAADLNHRFAVEKNTPTTNSDGQKVEAWRETFRVWVKLTSRGGMERRVFEQLRAECDYVAQMFWNSKTLGIKPADYRFRDIENEKIFNIADIFDPDGEKQQLHAHLTEIVV